MHVSISKYILPFKILNQVLRLVKLQLVLNNIMFTNVFAIIVFMMYIYIDFYCIIIYNVCPSDIANGFNVQLHFIYATAFMILVYQNQIKPPDIFFY